MSDTHAAPALKPFVARLTGPATTPDALRPVGDGFKAKATAWLMGRAMAFLPTAFGLLRTLFPILRIGSTTIVSRYDDVRAVFLDDARFGTPYADKLAVIMCGQPFFLGMGDTDTYRHDTEAMWRVIRREDIPVIAAEAERLADAILKEANGRIEVVDALVRRVTFAVCGAYLGVPDPPGGDLRVWGTRLFEFQFADPGNDPSLRAEVDRIAPALRAHITEEFRRRRANPGGPDDVLGRCAALAAAGEAPFADEDWVVTQLTGFIVGGPPQPPMVAPQALEQLLRRPEALMEARSAARRGDDERLRRYVWEAMRFDPLAPGLQRVALTEATIGEGLSRARTVPKGASILVAFSSAMRDGRRVNDPESFDPDRPDQDYIHFGLGLHECFGRYINRRLLPALLKPLLARSDLRRADGPAGHLVKRGAFAAHLEVLFVDPSPAPMSAKPSAKPSRNVVADA